MKDFLLAIYTSHATDMLDKVTDRKWRYQSICRPRFPVSVNISYLSVMHRLKVTPILF
jgi:hypothetical protein